MARKYSGRLATSPKWVPARAGVALDNFQEGSSAKPRLPRPVTLCLGAYTDTGSRFATDCAFYLGVTVYTYQYGEEGVIK